MTAENKECIQTCNKCIELDSKFTKAYYRRAKAHINMKNFLEGAKDYKQISGLPENTSVKEELEAVVKKNLGELQVKELEDLTVVIQTKPEVASQPTAQSKPSPLAVSQPQTFKRVNIVEEDDEDEEEEDKPQPANQAAPVAEASKAPVPAPTPQPEPAIAKPVAQPPAAPKIDKSVFLRELAKVQDVKAKAVDEIKKSMYEDAVALMKKTSTFFEDEEDRLVGLTPEQLQEYLNLKMGLHSNMALCYQQMDFPKKVIEYSDVVLDTFKAIGENQLQKDFGVLEKTLHRKALALEKCEKFKDARLLYYEIRKLNPTNMMASQGIQRCDEFLEDRHVDLSTPSSFKAPEEKPAVPTPAVQKVPEKKLEPIMPPKPAQTTEPHEPAKVEELSSGLSAPLKAFLVEYEKQKDTANGAFRENKFDQAISLYTKLIEQIELKHPEVVGHHNASFSDPTAADLLKLFVSLLSNRSMSYIKVTKFLLGLLDCDKILMLDPKNPKVYHRKYVCEEELARELRVRRKDLKQKEVVIDLINKEVGYLQNAISDLRILTSQAKEPQYEKKVAELEQLIGFGLKQRDTLQKEVDAAKQTPEKTVLVEEISKSDNLTEEIPAPRPAQTPAPKPHAPEGGATELDIDAITRKALNEIITSTNALPNANKFELDMKSFKTHYSLMWQYFEKFQDWWFLSVIYAKREPDAKCLEQVLNCILTKAQEDASRAEDSATVLLSFKKVNNAKLALKFLSKAGKAKMGEAAQYLLKTVGNASYEYSITNEFGEYLA